MLTAPVADRTTAPPGPSEQPDHGHDHQEGGQAHRQFDHASADRHRVSITALTARGAAAARLSDFQDAWAELTQADRAWFAEWLTSLLVDACAGELTTTG